MSAYYNEYDAKAAAWLRELIKAGLIAPGEVDERSIIDVKADDLRGFAQCHFFAGIGGWSYALRLAGWPDDRPVWTGSPPCQPFSNAGKQKAQADARHLWPVFFNLIRECKPTNIFGEQVEAAIRTGWLDDLQDDLEAENYAVGKIILPTCGIGGFHIRQRIWFVAERLADTNGSGRGEHCGSQSIQAEQPAIECVSDSCGLADSASQRQRADQSGRDCENREQLERAEQRCNGSNNGAVIGLADTTDNGHIAADGLRETPESSEQTRAQNVGQSSGSCDNSGLAEPDSARREQGQWHNQTAGHGHTTTAKGSDDRPKPADAPNSIWRNPDWLFCRDGKWRPAESSLLGLFNGLPDELVRSCNISPACNPLAKDQEARTMRLKGYGNAIVPAVAAEVIRAYLEAGGHELQNMPILPV